MSKLTNEKIVAEAREYASAVWHLSEPYALEGDRDEQWFDAGAREGFGRGVQWMLEALSTAGRLVPDDPERVGVFESMGLTSPVFPEVFRDR